MRRRREQFAVPAARQTQPPDPWFICARPNPRARLRLFCFPYAGGGASIFHTWPEGLPTVVEIHSAQLPGRGPRLIEEPFSRMPGLVDALAHAIVSHLDRPFAFFGHSLGAVVCFELARLLRKRRRSEPGCLFVSGAPAPQTSDSDAPIHALPQAQFMKRLRELDGTPGEVLESEEFMRLMLPTLRADFAISETYAYTRDAPLNCPIVAFGGIQDTQVSQARLAAWRKQTSGPFSLYMLPGKHFFSTVVKVVQVRAGANRRSRMGL